MNFNLIALYNLPLLILLVFLSFFVIYREPKSRVNRVFSAFIVAIAFWVLCLLISDGSRDYDTVLLWTRLAILGPILSIYFLVIFSYFFPYEKTKLTTHKAILLFIPVLFFIVLFPTDFNASSVTLHSWGTEPEVGPLYTLLIPYIAIYLTIFSRNLFIKYRSAKKYYGLQILYISFGIILMVAFGITTNLFLILAGEAQYSILGPASTLFLIGFISYAIIKHRFLELRFTVSRSIIFTILTSLVAASFIATTYITSNFFSNSAVSQYGLEILLSLLIVLSIQPAKSLLARLTDKYFFKAAVDYNFVSQQLSNIINQEYALPSLITNFSEALQKSLKLNFVKLILLDQQTNPLLNEHKKEITASQDLFQYMRENRQLVLADEFSRRIANTTDRRLLDTYNSLRQQFELFSAEVLIPIFFQKELIAIIIVGNKLSGSQFTLNDVQLFDLVAPQIASGIQKARLYQESLQFGETLKSEVARATADLMIANQKLRELDQAKSEFMSIASHQLRTPLAGIVGYLSMMVEGDYGKLEDNQGQVVKEIYGASQRLVRLVNTFLNVTRIEAGRFTINYSQVNIVEAVSAEVKELQPTADKRGVQLIYTAPTEAIIADADNDKIRDVFLNLIDNAIKYTPEGSVSIFIEREGDSFHFHTKDTGVGIEPTEAAGLFQKFVRGSGIARVQPNGSGLGLYIVKKIVEAHNGKVWVESEGPGKGSSFHVQIPLKANVPVEVK